MKGWQDIETSEPPHETELLVRVAGLFGVRLELAGYYPEGWTIVLRNTERVTHWMEIPEVRP
jgi:hypothetical protein